MRLSTSRLMIRPMSDDDLPAILRVLEITEADADRVAFTARYVHAYSVLPEVLEELHQPPYRDNAMELAQGGEVIGLAGLVPSFNPFAQLRPMDGKAAGATAGARVRAAVSAALNNPEVGLFYHVAPGHRRQGYAREAAEALIGHAFGQLGAHRIVAETSRDNAASIAVMRALGMTLHENAFAEPPWFEVVGILTNPAAAQLS